MNIDKNKIAINKFLGNINDNRYLAAYFAIAMVFVERYKRLSTDADTKIMIKNFVYYINEISVIDKELLEDMTYKLYSYVNMLNSPAKSMSIPNNFMDVIGVTTYINKSIIDAVDNHINDYKQTYKLATDIVNEYIENEVLQVG